MKKLKFFRWLIAGLCLWCSLGLAAQTIERIDPPNWWTGMKNPGLQLLVYGKNISETNANFTYEGVELKQTQRVESPNYLFLDLIVSDKAKPGKIHIEFKKDNQVMVSYDYELKRRAPGSAERKGFSSSDAIYMLMPDRFSNGDPANDNVPEMKEQADRSNPNGRHGGDIAGVQHHLDYISGLGFNAIWMTPLLENNQKAYSYHGYSITDFYRVDPRFGTNQDYADLVYFSHQKGLRMIQDMIFNHCGSECWWMKDLPAKDWIHQFPEFTRSNYRASVLVDPHASVYDKDKMQNGWFDQTMPDLNQKNPLLAAYLIQNSIWWVEFAGLDGIRMDTYPYPDKDFMAEWAGRVMNEYPNFNIVGEAWLAKASFVSYYQRNAKTFDGFNSNLPSVFDFPLYYAISSAFTEKDGWDKGTARLYDVLSEDFLYPDLNNIVIFADNHDLDRVYPVLGSNINNYKMLMAFLATTRGIPMMYYGTEILMDGQKGKSDGDIRKDFPGGWQGDQIDAFTKEGRTLQQNEAFDYLQKLLKWRHFNEAVCTGKLKQFIPEDGIYVYFRYTDKKTVMVLLNNNAETKTVNTGRYAECLQDFTTAKDAISGFTVMDLQTLKVPAKSAMILDLMK